MGCGSTLFLGADGYVTCSYLDCPEPDAVTTLLQDSETEHVVQFGSFGFTIRHPLRERLRDALMLCGLHIACSEMDGPPAAIGEYRARLRGGTWSWEPL